MAHRILDPKAQISVLLCVILKHRRISLKNFYFKNIIELNLNYVMITIN